MRSEDFYYVIGASDTVANPCDLPLILATDTITFTYDRERAARYAIEHSYANNLSSPGAYRVTRRLHPDLPFANFTYADLAGGTGSAMFTSESIWSGHLRMTIGDPNSCNLSLGASEVGWRVCTSSSGPNLNSSPAWDTHEGVLSYYTDGRPVGLSFFSSSSILERTRGRLILIDSLVIPSDRLTRSDLATYLVFPNLGIDRDITILNEAGLAEFIRLSLGHSPEQNVTRGDYVFINTSSPTSSTHGLIVLGWGPIVGCREAVTATISLEDLSSAANQSNLVPYVADSTSVQQPVPRPFYCTNWDQFDDPSLDFVAHSWFFFNMPNEAEINASHLNVPPTWQWELSDG